MRRFRVALAQINCTVGDFDGNVRAVTAQIAAADAQGADLIAFPELAITGYPPEDLALRRRFVRDNFAALERVREATSGRHVTAIVGFIDLDVDTYNAAAVLHEGQRKGVYHKQFLPTYGVFDESRCFRAGEEAPVFEIAGTRVGVSICEDIWYSSGPVREQAIAGAEVIININGSPFHAGKRAEREKMLATRASDNAVILCYLNLVGGQDALVFDGGSMIYNAQGELIATAPLFEEAMLMVDLDPDAALQVRLHDPRLRRLSVPDSPAVLVSSPVAFRDPLPAPVLSQRPQEEAEIYAALVLGTRDYLRKTGFEKAVVALSGGIDSSLTAVLAVDAVGAENVVGVSMPSRYSSEGSVRDARTLAENLGIRLLTIPIEGPFQAMLDALHESFNGTEPDVTEENLQARIRGTLVMALSNKFGWLLLSTSNKSETATGYTTLYGDMTGGLAVLQDVPKLLVQRLSRYVNEQAGHDVIPQSVLEKPPSAELRPGQLDEEGLLPYARLDPIIEAFVEEDRSLEEIVADGHAEEEVRRVMSLVTAAEYKRRQAAPGIKITPRAFGKERRFPIANRYRGF